VVGWKGKVPTHFFGVGECREKENVEIFMGIMKE